MNPTQPIPPELTEAQREEARRQAEANSGALADGAQAVADAASSGLLGAVGDVAGACLEGAATVAQASVEVIGGILGGLADL